MTQRERDFFNRILQFTSRDRPQSSADVLPNADRMWYEFAKMMMEDDPASAPAAVTANPCKKCRKQPTQFPAHMTWFFSCKCLENENGFAPMLELKSWNNRNPLPQPPAAPPELPLPACKLCGAESGVLVGIHIQHPWNKCALRGFWITPDDWRTLHAPRDSDEAVRLARLTMQSATDFDVEKQANAAAILARAGKYGYRNNETGGSK